MRVSVRGWGRDHGKKEIISNDILEAEFQTGEFYHSSQRANLHIARDVVGERVWNVRAVISQGAQLSLNGKYLVEIELRPTEIARLFYLTHSEKSLNDLVGTLAQFKQEREREVEEEAKRQEAKQAKKIRRL